jgi:hypothetical protein
MRAVRKPIDDMGLDMDIVWPGCLYDPKIGSPYVEFRLARNDVTAADLSHTNMTDGAFSLTVCFPAGDGVADAETLLNTLEDGYKIGSRLEYDGVLVEIRTSSRGDGVPADGWYKQSLTITYRAFLRR